MSEESRKYTLEQQMVIDRAMEGDLRFFFNGEEDLVQYGFIEYLDGSWHIKKLMKAGIIQNLNLIFWFGILAKMLLMQKFLMENHCLKY